MGDGWLHECRIDGGSFRVVEITSKPMCMTYVQVFRDSCYGHRGKTIVQISLGFDHVLYEVQLLRWTQ